MMRGRIMRAVGADSLGQVINIGIRILLIPLFLSAWGAEAYGEWLLISAVAAWFGLGDLGAQLYFVNRLTSAWAIDAHDEFQQLLSTGLVLFLLVSSSLLACVFLLLVWSPTIQWLELKVISQSDAYLVLMFMAAKLLFYLPVGLYLGIYRAMHAQATSVMYANLMLLIQFIASASALKAGFGVVVLASLEILPLIVIIPIIVRDLRRRLPKDIKLFYMRGASRKILRSAISPSFHFLGIQIAMVIVAQGSIIAVAKALGPVEVAVFSSMRTISNVVIKFLSVLSHSAWPEFTRLDRMGEQKKLSALFKLILSVTLLVGLSFLLILDNAGEVFYDYWLGGKLPYDASVMFLLGCFVITTSLWTLGGNLLMATNEHREYSRWQLPVNSLAIIFCFWGASELGLTGAVYGLIIGQSIFMIILVVFLLRSKKWKENSTFLLRLSILSALLLPASLNILSGLAGITVVALLVIIQARRWTYK